MSSILGTVAKQLKSHPALIPLFIFIGGGATMSMMYLGRLALRNPDVSWDHKNNPEPWNNLQPDHQYKMFTVNMDYSKLKKDRPDF
ncbi:cytochrome c oxidase subunit NDUFA4 [Notolabrus celidotus]|uniref:cytochrome c oxidase subunit NDUFA4 n=1 Tax=Notolabrus celidotus TaxID=1203425 RepID=UPI00148FDBCF|nr:cytochrome c oxidase subunit NDUFA4 [Notolabrus celidotus]